MTPHDDQRDLRLAALLRATVDAPPLRPGFHDELEARLTAANGAGLGAVTTVPAWRRRYTTRRILVAAAVTAAAAGFAFVVLPALRGADTATAGDVLAAMTATTGGAQTVRLHAVSEAGSGNEARAVPDYRSVDETELTMDIAGDSLSLVTSTWGNVLPDGTWRKFTSTATSSYDEALHEERSFPRDEKPRWNWNTHVRRPAWADEWAAVGEYPQLSARLRAALAEKDTSMPVKEATYLGRPSWRSIFTVREHWGPEHDVPVAFHWDVTVDQETGLLVAAGLRMEYGGKPVPFTLHLRVTSLELNPMLEPGWQRPALPAGKVTIVDDGTRFGTPEQVAKRSWPTLPLIPQWAPAGYRRTDVASTGTGTMSIAHPSPNVTVKRTKPPLSDPSVLVRFRRGFSSFVVRITPKTSLGERIDGKPDVVLTGGYLKGRPAVFGDDSSDGTQMGIHGPLLVTYSDRSKVVITGDLTGDELVKVANSMKVYGDLERQMIPGFGY